MCKSLIFLTLWTAVLQCTVQDAIKDFANGNHRFTADIYKQLTDGKNNSLIASPFSAETVLSLTSEGAKGTTATEIINGVHLPNSTTERHTVFRSLLSNLKTSSSSFQLLFANRIYVSQRYQLKETFENTAISVYQANVTKINFYNKDQAAKSINQWVESQTNNKIQNLISPDSITEYTAMILINTLYLKGKWVTPFASGRTTKEPFYSPSGKTELVETMHSKDLATYRFFQCGNLSTKFLEIPFNDSHVSMTFILPGNDDSYSQLAVDLEPYLSPHRFRDELVYVAIPKFSISTTTDLGLALRKLGVRRPFNPSLADFSGISSDSGLYIDSVSQKAFINVTETGVEAAAATSVTFVRNIISPHPVLTFIANRPFVYYIRDDASGAILFVGRYTNELSNENN